MTFLSWKDVRKNVRASDDKANGDADFAAGEDPAAADALGDTGPGPDPAKKNKKAKIRVPWGLHSFYSEIVPEREDEEDEEGEEMNLATLQRLQRADERTRHMTKEEYVNWSECRQASFTFRKGKRFREWAGFAAITDSKPNDDVIDILGFLTFEMVQSLTEEALRVKESEGSAAAAATTTSAAASTSTGKTGAGAAAGANSAALGKRKRERGPFGPPEDGPEPIQPRHVREAYRVLQARILQRTRAFRDSRRAFNPIPLPLVCDDSEQSMFLQESADA